MFNTISLFVYVFNWKGLLFDTKERSGFQFNIKVSKKKKENWNDRLVERARVFFLAIFKLSLAVAARKNISGIAWTATARGGRSCSHTSKSVRALLAKRAWCTKSQSWLLNIYFRFRSVGSSPDSNFFNSPFTRSPSFCFKTRVGAHSPSHT